MDSIFNGKIVLAIDFSGKEHDVRVVDKLRKNGDDLYLCVNTDGSTFLTNNIKKVHNRIDARTLWNKFFSLLFTDSQNV